MSRFSVKEKFQAVQDYLSGKESYSEIGARIGIDYKSVIKWVAFYRAHGMEGLAARYTTYSKEFKMDVLRFMNESGASLLETAVTYNIAAPSAISNWRRILEEEGEDALEPMKKGRLSMKKEKKATPVEGSIEALQAEIQHLRMENAYFKKVECLSSKQGKVTKQVKAQVVFELRHEFPITALLQLAQIPRSSYYYWVATLERPDKDADVKARIKAIYDEHRGRYGYRRIRDQLHNEGHQINHKRVQRMMGELGLKCTVRMKKYRSYKGNVGKIAPNVLDRNFKAKKPNEKWVTDITEFKLFGEKVYLAPMLDLFSGEIITYTIESRPVYSLVSKMLDKAFEHINDGDQLMIHSDQGWHYQMGPYQQALKKRGITQSMSRKGNCYDNAVIENFFGILKSEFLYRQEFESMEHFKKELKQYIDYYNHKRIKAKLKGMSPVQYRIHTLKAA
ncbi:IS3 family transposase [Paenibacillus doosanensis]|uniref:IS3 family transposase n=2 Tax=Paenibacillus doosanensis TaxID=1229154 RepID=UPI00217F5309|nr:IS3 family transposase [Paenibacillus doosanensis]MCS7465044.1 IS3 family transposase [Paenibacillus doosanensis]